MIKDLLQGKPLGHPLHTMLVHLPIGLFVFSLVLDLGSFVADDGNPLVRGAFFAMLAGLIAAAVAAIPGLADWAEIRADHRAKKTATTHMLLNLAAVVVYLISLLLRAGARDDDSAPIAAFIFSLVGIGLISISGYLGGSLVYGDGIGVGRHRRRAPLPQETIVVRPAEASGFIPVIAATDLTDGETIRVDLDGTIVVIASVEGTCYAFQEFCTHRYGPLSEGRLCDHEIECPWHRSRFDVRSGKVTEGPAKVDLKTFDVVVRDGMIAIRPVEHGAAFGAERVVQIGRHDDGRPTDQRAGVSAN